MLRLIREHVEHAGAHLRALAEDSLELVGGGLVDREPPKFAVSHLHECIRAFDYVGEQLAFRERVANPLFERLVQLAQSTFRQHSPRRFLDGTEHSRDFPAFVADRGIGEREPGLLVITLSVHDQRKILAVGRAARHRRVNQRADVRPDLRPYVLEASAERARMLGPENLGVGVVVEESKRVPPCHEHRKLRLQEQPDDRAQRLRPGFWGTQRRL